MNLPSAFLTRMQEMLGEEYEAFLQSYESGHYQSLRLNPRIKLVQTNLREGFSFVTVVPLFFLAFYC